ncbi:MAG: hypothetical protein LBJ12_03575 [Oscillospiraceae bacterium]|nr:hypothetical protein [Oscillospiraceae bacterium]
MAFAQRREAIFSRLQKYLPEDELVPIYENGTFIERKYKNEDGQYSAKVWDKFSEKRNVFVAINFHPENFAAIPAQPKRPAAFTTYGLLLNCLNADVAHQTEFHEVLFEYYPLYFTAFDEFEAVCKTLQKNERLFDKITNFFRKIVSWFKNLFNFGR